MCTLNLSNKFDFGLIWFLSLRLQYKHCGYMQKSNLMKYWDERQYGLSKESKTEVDANVIWSHRVCDMVALQLRSYVNVYKPGC